MASESTSGKGMTERNTGRPSGVKPISPVSKDLDPVHDPYGEPLATNGTTIVVADRLFGGETDAARPVPS